MKYIFVCGAARSGTTLIAKLFGNNPRIILGMERYKNILNTSEFGASLFGKDRFFDFREGDTNIRRKTFQEHYDIAVEKYDDVVYIGDKVPGIYKSIERINKIFIGNVTFLFCHRNIYDVAASWNVRALNPNDKWPIENNYIKCVDAWQRSLRNAIRAKKKRVKIIAIDYDRFTGGGVSAAEIYYSERLNELGLDLDHKDLNFLNFEFGKIPLLQSKRNSLTCEMRDDVNKLIDFELVAEFDSIFGAFHVDFINNRVDTYVK